MTAYVDALILVTVFFAALAALAWLADRGKDRSIPSGPRAYRGGRQTADDWRDPVQTYFRHTYEEDERVARAIDHVVYGDRNV